MKASAIHDFGENLIIEEKKIPVPGKHQIQIKACRFCHTDLYTCRGDSPIKPVLPLVPGHGGVGVVTRLGDRACHLNEGDRVGIPCDSLACGHREYCLEGKETLCPDRKNTDYSVDGGYAEFCLVDADYVIKIRDKLDFVSAAPLLCAGVITYKALKDNNTKPGGWVSIVGIGELDHLAIQYARALDLNVIAVDTGSEKRQLSLDLGAAHFIDFMQEVPHLKTRQLLGNGVHSSVCTSASKPSLESVSQSVRFGGRCALVGLPPDDMPLSINNTAYNGIYIVGSIVGTRLDVIESLALAAHGKIKSIIQERSLEDINQIFHEMEKGEITRHIVISMTH